MNAARRAPFDRLLRWYPQEWREKHGAVLLGTLLDDAESHNRTAPTPGERGTAIVYGLGARLTPRLALRTGFAALAAAAVAGGLWVWALPSLVAAGGPWVLPLLTVAVGPTLITIAAIALARHASLLSEPRALLALGLAVPALVLGALTQIGWGVAFDAADAGVPAAGLGTAWAPLFLAAWLMGAGAIALLLHAAARRTRLPGPWAAVLSTLLGAITAPTLGLALLSPTVPAIAAGGVSLLALLAARSTPHDGRAGGVTARAMGQRIGSASAIPIPTRRLAHDLSRVAAAGGLAGVIYALTGSAWPLSTVDGTAAMGQGIVLSLTAALPLLAAVGLLTSAAARVSPRQVWGPLTLVALALGGVAVAYQQAPAWDGMAPGFAVASALGGAAIAWWIIPRVRGSRAPRVALGALAGICYAAFAGMMIAPLLAFALPICAVLVATVGTRPPGRAATAAPVQPAGGHPRASRERA